MAPKSFARKLRGAVRSLAAASAIVPAVASAQLVEGKPLSHSDFEWWLSKNSHPVASWKDIDAGKRVVILGEDHNLTGHFDFLSSHASQLRDSGITHAFFEFDAGYQPALDAYL